MKSSSLFFYNLLQIIAGLLNYLFQFFLVKNLSVASFGEFTTWLSTSYLFFVFASAAQIYSNFHILDSLQLKRSSIYACVTSLCLFLLTYLTKNPFHLTLLLILSTIIFSFFTGQVQARFMLIFVGLFAVLIGIFKIGLFFTYKSIKSDQGLLLPAIQSVVEASIIAALLISLFCSAVKTTNPQKQGSFFSFNTFLVSLTLATATVVFPLLDFLAMMFTKNPQELGLNAQLNLCLKLVYFAAMIFFQALLPFQIQSKISVISYLGFKNILVYLFPSVILIASIATFILPSAWALTTGNEFLPESRNIFLGIINIFAYCLVYFLIQTLASLRQTAATVFTFISTLILPALNYYWFQLPLIQYQTLSLLILVALSLSVIVIVNFKGATSREL